MNALSQVNFEYQKYLMILKAIEDLKNKEY